MRHFRNRQIILKLYNNKNKNNNLKFKLTKTKHFKDSKIPTIVQTQRHKCPIRIKNKAGFRFVQIILKQILKFTYLQTTGKSSILYRQSENRKISSAISLSSNNRKIKK